MAVGTLTAFFYVLARAKFFSLAWPLVLCDESASCQGVAPLVRLSYLTTAVGVALTSNRLIARSALWARDASRALIPSEPKFSARATAVQLSMVTVACIVEELEAPSPVIVTFGQWIGEIWL